MSLQFLPGVTKLLPVFITWTASVVRGVGLVKARLDVKIFGISVVTMRLAAVLIIMRG